MGKVSRQQRRAHNRHVRKSFGGRSVEDVHAELAFPPHAKCSGCGRKPMIRAIVMAPLDEAKKRMPAIDAAMLADPEGFMSNIVQIRENQSDKAGKPYFRLSVTYACKSCGPSMERQLAKAPSWCIVEINRGPDPERIIVS